MSVILGSIEKSDNEPITYIQFPKQHIDAALKALDAGYAHAKMNEDKLKEKASTGLNYFELVLLNQTERDVANLYAAKQFLSAR